MKKVLFISTCIVLSSFDLAQDLHSLANKLNDKTKSNDLESAETLLNTNLGVYHPFVPAQIVFSKIWLPKGNLTKTNECATLAVRSDKQFRPLWEKLDEIRSNRQSSQKYIQQNNFDKAFNKYQTISKKYSYFSRAQFSLVTANYKHKEFQEAALFFKNALKIYPNYNKTKKA